MIYFNKGPGLQRKVKIHRHMSQFFSYLANITVFEKKRIIIKKYVNW